MLIGSLSILNIKKGKKMSKITFIKDLETIELLKVLTTEGEELLFEKGGVKSNLRERWFVLAGQVAGEHNLQWKELLCMLNGQEIAGVVTYCDYDKESDVTLLNIAEKDSCNRVLKRHCISKAEQLIN